MKSINLILGNHNHQPIGNFDFVIESVYNKAYKPFLDILLKYKDIKFNMHYTGPLIDWLQANKKEHLEDLKKLSDRGQIEFQSGGYYEPILPSIPNRDKVEQIKKLNEYIKDKFGVVARGMWLAERVWEPSLVSTLVECGIEYLALDDSQFIPTGLDRDEMFGYFTTDNEDKRMNVFPISQNLRYLVPFHDVEETIEYLKTVATEEGDRLLVLHDDGEKYGDWPGTYKWIYEDKWLETFFKRLSEEKSWIKTTTYSEYISKYKPLGRVYIPTGSYEEMLTWVLPAKAQYALTQIVHDLKHVHNEEMLRFIRGGFWRNYFSKYSESNRMHKRMLLTSKLVSSMPEGKNKNEAYDYTLKSQCNCPYWHGTFGGLYLNNLRHATYQNIIKATTIAENSLYGNDLFDVKELDYDLDGYNEVYTTTAKESFILHTLSGSVVEWDVKTEHPINLVDTMKRQEEAYHIAALRAKDNNSSANEHVSIHEIVKTIDSETEKYLVFDKNSKVLFVDHFLDKMPNANDFNLMKYEEVSSLNNRYFTLKNTKKNNDSIEVVFECLGKIKDKEVEIVKTYTIKKEGSIKLKTSILNKSNETIEFVYGTENNITLLAGNDKDRFFIDDKGSPLTETLSSTGEYKAKSIGLRDRAYIKIDVILNSDEESTFLYMPNYTISDAVDKLEMNYQNSTVVNLKEYKVAPSKKAEYSLSIGYKEIMK